jgi:hypothetical protein
MRGTRQSVRLRAQIWDHWQPQRIAYFLEINSAGVNGGELHRSSAHPIGASVWRIFGGLRIAEISLNETVCSGSIGFIGDPIHCELLDSRIDCGTQAYRIPFLRTNKDAKSLSTTASYSASERQD